MRLSGLCVTSGSLVRVLGLGDSFGFWWLLGCFWVSGGNASLPVPFGAARRLLGALGRQSGSASQDATRLGGFAAPARPPRVWSAPVRHKRVTPDQSRPALPFAARRKAEFVLRRALSHVARGGVGTSQDRSVTHSSCGCSTSPPFLESACNGASDRTVPRAGRRRIEDTKRFRACQVGSTALCDCMTHGMPGGISDTGSDCVPFRMRPPFRAPSFGLRRRGHRRTAPPWVRSMG